RPGARSGTSRTATSRPTRRSPSTATSTTSSTYSSRTPAATCGARSCATGSTCPRSASGRSPLSGSIPSRPEAFTRYHGRLLLLVSLATLFEGFDTLLLSLALPYLGAEFGVDPAASGRAVGTINLGTVLAFAPVRLADRYGRRPILLAAVAGYT